MDEIQKQRRLVEKIKVAAEYISNMGGKASANWVMTNIIGHDKIEIRKHKIKRILNDETREI